MSNLKRRRDSDKECFRWTCQSYRETLPMYIHEKYQFQGNSQNSDKTDMKFVQ